MEWSIHKLMRLGLVFLQSSFNDLVIYIYSNFNDMSTQGQNQYEYKKYDLKAFELI
jgi:hypothetical protein